MHAQLVAKLSSNKVLICLKKMNFALWLGFKPAAIVNYKKVDVTKKDFCWD